MNWAVAPASESDKIFVTIQYLMNHPFSRGSTVSRLLHPEMVALNPILVFNSFSILPRKTPIFNRKLILTTWNSHLAGLSYHKKRLLRTEILLIDVSLITALINYIRNLPSIEPFKSSVGKYSLISITLWHRSWLSSWYVVREVIPGPTCTSPEDMRQFVSDNIMTAFR